MLATVGNHTITVADFNQEVARRVAARRPVPEKAVLLEEMVQYEALMQRASASGLLDDAQMKREIGNLVIARLKERELKPRLDNATVTREEIQAEYESSAAKYTRPAKVRLAALFLEAGSKAGESRRAETRSRMEEGRKKFVQAHSRGQAVPDPIVPSSTIHHPSSTIQPITGFGALAANYSDDQASRFRGGDIGWLDNGNYSYRWPRKVLESGYSLPQGEVSEVIEGDAGFYLVMKTDARESVITPLANVEGAIRHGLLAKKRQSLEQAFHQEAARLAPATIQPAALNSITLPSNVKKPSGRDPEPEPPQFPGVDLTAKRGELNSFPETVNQ